MKRHARLISRVASGLVLAAIAAGAAHAGAPQKVYGRTIAESSAPVWPEPVRAPKGAPNVLIIMTDDVGFGATSTFGGPIPTPTFEALARQGLRYNQFNTTAICSPTRASLLTGRDPQAVGVGYVTNWSTGYDGYNSVIPKSAGALPRILRDHGYSTAMFGKWHLTPEWEMSAAGPFDHWPTGMGFDYYYGFLGADSSMFVPSLTENNRTVAPPAKPGYHFDADMADRAIGWIDEHRAIAPDKPFLIYYATGTAHAPNQAPSDWLARFRGKFDTGWDALRAETVRRQKALGVIPPNTHDAPRPETLPRWEDLTGDQRRLYARYMEAYAASLAYADAQIGRVVDRLRETGQLENTLIIYIQGDNGASAEGSFDGKLFEQSALSGVQESRDYALANIDDIGGPAAYNLMPGGWGWAMNAPFRWAKRYASHFGGTRNALVMSWPRRIHDAGGLRSQYHHISDIMPTILDVAGVDAPRSIDGVAQQPVTGISMAYTIDAPAAASHRTMQVYGMAQNLSLYRDGWVAATTPMLRPWEPTRPAPVAIDDRNWELYDVRRDFSQAHDLAAAEPGRLAAMKAQFWAEAGKAGILPIHASEGNQAGRPDLNEGRTAFTYRAGMTHIPESAAPATVGKSFTMAARIVVPTNGANGVIAAQGGRYGGYSLFLENGRPTFTYNLTPAHLTKTAATAPLAPGRHIVTVDFAMDRPEPTAPATVTLEVDGKPVASARVDRTFASVVSHTEGFDVGEDTITPVDPGYDIAGSRFTGTLEQLDVTLP